MAQLNALDVLAQPPKTWASVIVLYGTDSTLHSWVLNQLCPRDSDEDRVDLAGDQLEWRDLRDELSSGSLFTVDGQRWVVVPQADKFVEVHREALEAYVLKPSRSTRLVLRLNSFPANLRLYKAVAAEQQAIQCAVPSSGKGNKPDLARLQSFLVDYVAPKHQCKLQKSAAESLIEMVGYDLGFLSNSIAKLALHLPIGGTINESMVHEIIGGWQLKSTWDLIDAAANGQAADALKHLNRMLDDGNAPLALLPQFAWSLRRLAMANAAVAYAERTGKRQPLATSLAQAGFKNSWESQRGEKQLRQIGRQRASQLMGWLLDADLKLKLTHSDEKRGRWVLEELFLKLAST